MDWRLGLGLRAAQTVLVVLLIIRLVFQRQYLRLEVPDGTTNSWAERRDFNITTASELLSQNSLPYCNNASYDFILDSFYQYTDIACILLPFDALWRKARGQIFVMTEFTEQRFIALAADSQDECAALFADSVPELGNTTQSYLDGACIQYTTSDYFPVDAEKVGIAFQHSYFSTGLDELSGNLPQTHIRLKGSDEDLKVFTEDDFRGSGLSLKLEEILEWLKVYIDKPINLQDGITELEFSRLEGSGQSQGQYPVQRMTGVNINMNLKYYNYNLQKGTGLNGKSSGPGYRDVVCILEIEPEFGWNSWSNEPYNMFNTFQDPQYISGSGTFDQFSMLIYQPRGITFTFKPQGTFGAWDYQAILVAITSNIVLLGVAHTIVNLIALNLLGIRSELYKSVVNEKCDFAREYARFAVQAVVASYVFGKLDADRGNGLNDEEIFSTLYQYLGHTISVDQVVAITNFVMLQNEQELSEKEKFKMKFQKKQQLAIGSKHLSTSEWIDAFTEDKTSFKQLLQVMDLEMSQGVDTTKCDHWSKGAQAAIAQARETEGQSNQGTPESIQGTPDDQARGIERDSARDLLESNVGSVQNGEDFTK